MPSISLKNKKALCDNRFVSAHAAQSGDELTNKYIYMCESSYLRQSSATPGDTSTGILSRCDSKGLCCCLKPIGASYFERGNSGFFFLFIEWVPT